jgi:hypothetical protein
VKQLPAAPAQYSREDQASLRRLIQEELRRCVKTDEQLTPVRFVLIDTVTGTNYQLTVASGALTLTAV